MMKRLSIVFIVFLQLVTSHAQNIDVLHYRFEVELSDGSDSIKGRAVVQIKFLNEAAHFVLNLKSVEKKTGMQALKVAENNVLLASTHALDSLIIQLKQPAKAGEIRSFEILYAGIPADGLIISKNKYGDRTFFADNWPNRAQHWIPCHDVPNDKATVEFIVTAPSYYQVISNGIQIEETNLDRNRKLTHWKEDIPLPTKVMVIGAAQFAVGRVDTSYSIPVTAWVYPQDKAKGFYDYALATGILKFMSEYIGPYAFKKLANVQSKTIYGGMENASAIFYSETSINGKRGSEALLVHEIVHQWFGNMATEKSFPHLWLSEGFATYLTHFYWEKKYGRKAFVERLQEDREEVVDFARKVKRPVVDSASALMDLLNPNSYQKGGWILHMLRTEVGDSSFHKIVKTYYQQYKGSNADTRDFQQVAETVSGKNLKWFFDQWLYQPGVPKINAEWKLQGSQLAVTIRQTGEHTYQFPLTIGYTVGEKMQSKKIVVTKANETFTFAVNGKPSKIVLDPSVELLFEGSVK